MHKQADGIDLNAVPSGTGCVECLASDGWWLHLRRCAKCGHIGCCDDSLSKHATRHFRETGHAILTSFEPGEDWFWDYERDEPFEGPTLLPPHAHPISQPTPGPEGKVPDDWDAQLG